MRYICLVIQVVVSHGRMSHEMSSSIQEIEELIASV